MWEKSGESVKIAKVLAEKLGEVWRDKEFIIDVMDAIDRNVDICNQVIDCLDKNPYRLPSEVFDKLSELGCTVKYKKPEVVKLMQNYTKNPSLENQNRLLETLKSANVLMISKWDLTEDEKAEFENANVGDIVNIETGTKAILFINEEDDVFLLPIYTSKYEIGRKYRSDNYCIQEVDFSYIEKIIKSLKMQDKKVCLIINHDSDENVIIPCKNLEDC